MDLNRLYFKHQISLMRVASASDVQSRDTQQAVADGFARSIEQFRQGFGSRTAAACYLGSGL